MNLFRSRFLLILLLIAGLAATAVLIPIARAETITVNTTADDVAVNGNCTLREAVIAANTDTAVDACPAGNGADTIILPAGDYRFTLGGYEDDALAGDLDITADLTLTGAGRANTSIDANGLDQVFEIDADTVHISRVTITGGNWTEFASGIEFSGDTLTVTNSRVTNNTGRSGIYVLHGTLTLISSRVDNNDNTASSGGGIGLNTGATALLINSLVDGNTAANNGGGIYNLRGTLAVVNSTVSGNSAGDWGGGIYSGSTTSLFNATITNNTADSDSDIIGEGGGIYFDNSFGLPVFNVKNSIISGNFDNSAVAGSSDCTGTLTSQGYNLIENTNDCVITGDTTGNITGLSPNLGPLQNNGGAPQTHALLAGSPAINAGNPAGCLDQNDELLTTDQRGYARNGVCDVGAYEYDSPGPATPTPTATTTHTPTLTPTPTPSATGTMPAESSTPSVTPPVTSSITPETSPTASLTPEVTPSITPTLTPADNRVYLPFIQK